MAQALGWPNAPVGWAEILKLAQDPQGWGRYGHPEWGRFQLGKTSPLESTSGLHSLLATYYAATGVSADLTAGNVSDPAVNAFVRGVESSVLHYGDTVSTFLDELRAADDRGAAMTYVSAVATEETQVLAYNAKRPATPLVALYPRDGTLVADHPFAVLNAPWVSDRQRQAAEAFGRWLLDPARQARFMGAGFRNHDGRLATTKTAADGVLAAGPPLVLKAPPPSVLALVRNSWADVRKRARVLLVLDVSGSMEGAKLDQVKKAAVAALGLFADDDKLGLWTFSDDVTRVEPIGLVGPQRQEFTAEVQRLFAAASTALYKATRLAVGAVQDGWDPDRINAVIVLTDGQNASPEDDREGLLRMLRGRSLERPVPVFTIAYGSDADLQTLKEIASATHGRAYNAPDPAHVTDVFTAVVSNF
jgi:Ca-activated chloride channel family protein